MGRGLTAALFLGAVLLSTSRELRSQEDNGIQGQWQITIPSRLAYNGLALIDAEYRTTWDDGYGPPFHGYVAHTDSMEAEIILTDGVGVVHALCTIQSSDLLHCEHRYGNGRVSNLFVLTRTGPGPKTLLPVPPDIDVRRRRNRPSALEDSPESKSDSPEHFGRSGVTHLPAESEIDSTGRKAALAFILAAKVQNGSPHHAETAP